MAGLITLPKRELARYRKDTDDVDSTTMHYLRAESVQGEMLVIYQIKTFSLTVARGSG